MRSAASIPRYAFLSPLDVWATFIKDFKALLTASSVGNASLLQVEAIRCYATLCMMRNTFLERLNQGLPFYIRSSFHQVY